MRSSFLIARVAGIEIRVHLTFFLLVALFALASTAPDSLGLASAMVWLVVIFTCVVIHELAHSLVARRRGVMVHEIVLLPIGGVSKLESLPESPPDELAIAIAGPLASLGLAAGAALVAIAAGVPLLPLQLYDGPLIARTAWFNLIIAAFNLLPAFPLDGGRVFRALLERRYDLERSTHIAARVGRAVAIVLVVAGVFVNLWFVIIGVFVYMGATVEEQATVVHVRLRGRRVRDLMLLDPVLVRSDMPTRELRELLRHEPQRAFPVVGPQGYEGIVDAHRIRLAREDADAGQLADHTAPLLSAAADVEQEALPLVVHAPGHALAVVDNGGIVGLLRIEDVEHLIVDPHAATD